MARAAPALGLSAGRVTLSASGREIGECLVLSRALPFGATLRAALRGPVWTLRSSEADRALALRQLHEDGVHLIEAGAPEPGLRHAGFGMVMTPGATCRLDIAAEDWRLAIHPKWEASLRRARKAAVRIEALPFDDAPAAWLMRAEADLRRSRGFRSIAAPLARAIHARAPEALDLRIARTGSEILAAMLFVRHGDAATYLMGATSDAGREVCAHHLILNDAAETLRAAGLASIDLGQVDTVGNPGLTRFKLGTGAQLTPLGGSWIRLPRLHGPALAGRGRSSRRERVKD